MFEDDPKSGPLLQTVQEKKVTTLMEMSHLKVVVDFRYLSLLYLIFFLILLSKAEGKKERKRGKKKRKLNHFV